MKLRQRKRAIAWRYTPAERRRHNVRALLRFSNAIMNCTAILRDRPWRRPLWLFDNATQPRQVAPPTQYWRVFP